MFSIIDENINLEQTFYIWHDNCYSRFNLENRYENHIVRILTDNHIRVWINNDGKICCQVSEGEIKYLSINQAEQYIGSILGLKVKFIYNNGNAVTNGKINDMLFGNIFEIPIYLLHKVKDEEFSPNEKQKFIGFIRYFTTQDGFVSYNRFRPTAYMLNSCPLDRYGEFNIRGYSIAEYLYDILDHNENSFLFLMSALSLMFKNADRCIKKAIIFLNDGENDSLKWFFDTVISELFGYYLKIDNRLIKSDKLLYSELNEKLIYFFDKPEQMDSSVNLLDLIRDLAKEDEIFDYRAGKKIRNYGNLFVKTNDFSIPFIDKDSDYYHIIKVADKPIDYSDYSNPNIRTITPEIYDFACLLMAWDVNNAYSYIHSIKDDRELILQNIDDKVCNFADIVINRKINALGYLKRTDEALYKEIKSDFNNSIIKQKNLIKYFIALYPDEEDVINARVLMQKLREVNNEFFKKERLYTDSKGKKFYKLPISKIEMLNAGGGAI